LTATACGLCDRAYWTVEDDGNSVWCRRWTIEECREHWAEQERKTANQKFKRRVDQVLVALGIGPKLVRPRPSGESLIERLKAAYSIEDVLGRLGSHLPMGRTRGTIPCPLHNERNGRAFSYDLDRQKWKCWGQCGQHGDVIDLVRIAQEKGMINL
jgi:hypothetical protein